jgi:hypothetical protein
MDGLANARQIAMQSQESAVAREKIRYDLKAKELDIAVGDQVWVAFPNVGKGKSRKLAFKMHGPYVVKEFLHGAKRVALLGHVDDEADEIRVHVDRMVKKKELPESLRLAWQPIRLDLVRDVEQAGPEQQVQVPAQLEKPKGRKPKAVPKLDAATAAELEKALDDEDFRIEKILDHQEASSGAVRYKVRFVGYGPKDDLWYDDEDLLESAPEMVADYQEQVEAKAATFVSVRSRRQGKKSQD